MRRPPALLPLIALFVASTAAAQGRGRSVLLLKVHDDKGQPISDAQVVVGGVTGSGRSNAGGEALLGSIPAGNRLIELRRPGYAMVRIAADFADADTVRREVAMTPQPIELEGVTATSWGRSVLLRRNGFYSRQRQGQGAFMTADRIEHLHPLDSSELFRYMRGFMVQQTKDGPVVIGTRGTGLQKYCIPLVYVDGMSIAANGIKEQGEALGMVRPDDILAVEAYQGVATIPAEYNPTGSACGVILFWTRN